MRVTTSKSKNSESFYINYAYKNKNGKSTSKIYEKLGTLDELMKSLDTDRDGVLAWAKERAKIATDEYKKQNETVLVPFYPNKQISKNYQYKYNCGYLFLQSICANLRFDNITRNIKSKYKYEFNLEAIMTGLIYSRILDPSSKKSSYEFCSTLLETPKYELADVYRALSIIAKESDYIQSELYKNSNFIHPRNTEVLYYDCTNYYFEIEQNENMKQYGKSKENRPNPIVGMGLFMDSEGIPLSFGMFPGNQNEQKSMKPLEKKIINDFDCSEFVYCSDSGLSSYSNKYFNSMGNRHYVITQSLKKMKKDDRDIALQPTQFRKLGSNKFIDISKLDESKEEVYNAIYYKEIPADSKIENEIYIVTYSPKYKEYQRKIRNSQIERAEKMIASGKAKKAHHNPNDPARFITKTSITDNGEVAAHSVLSLNQQTINNEKQYDGFYCVSTNMNDNVSRIISINQKRWKIEECFRIMKTEFKARPVYLTRDDRIEAHFLICFLALLVFRLLESQLHNKYTCEQIIETLRNMELREIEGVGYIPAYTRSDLTDDLHSLYQFDTDRDIITKSKMREIIKKSKNSKILR